MRFSILYQPRPATEAIPLVHFAGSHEDVPQTSLAQEALESKKHVSPTSPSTGDNEPLGFMTDEEPTASWPTKNQPRNLRQTLGLLCYSKSKLNTCSLEKGDESEQTNYPKTFNNEFVSWVNLHRSLTKHSARLHGETTRKIFFPYSIESDLSLIQTSLYVDHATIQYLQPTAQTGTVDQCEWGLRECALPTNQRHERCDRKPILPRGAAIPFWHLREHLVCSIDELLSASLLSEPSTRRPRSGPSPAVGGRPRPQHGSGSELV